MVHLFKFLFQNYFDIFMLHNRYVEDVYVVNKIYDEILCSGNTFEWITIYVIKAILLLSELFIRFAGYIIRDSQLPFLLFVVRSVIHFSLYFISNFLHVVLSHPWEKSNITYYEVPKLSFSNALFQRFWKLSTSSSLSDWQNSVFTRQQYFPIWLQKRTDITNELTCACSSNLSSKH